MFRSRGPELATHGKKLAKFSEEILCFKDAPPFAIFKGAQEGEGGKEKKRSNKKEKCIGLDLILMQCMVGEWLSFFCITFIMNLVLCLLTFVFK